MMLNKKIDLILLAGFLTTFICNVGNGTLLKLQVESVNAELIIIINMTTCLSVAFMNLIVQKFEKVYSALFKNMPLLMFGETLIYLGLTVYAFLGNNVAWVFYVCNNIAYCTVTTLIICCGRRLNRFRYTKKERESKDNMQNILCNLAVVFGGLTALIINVSEWKIEYIIIVEFIGVTIDNVLYTFVHREVIKEHPESILEDSIKDEEMKESVN